jgi:hypothetical protein
MNFNRWQRAALLMCVMASPVLAGAAEGTPAPAKVLMLGAFHFANPGLDMVKSGVIDVMTPANQDYLDGLATRLAAFAPTDVLVECEASAQPRLDAEFDGYRKGTFALKSNETYQIGFRVAKAAGLDRVTCFDEGQVGWEAEPMFNYIKAHDPAMQAAMEATFKMLSERTGQEQATLSLPQLLQLSNDAARDRENKDLYIRTNAVDAGGGFAGADASASWWHRNFRMYANVQKAAAPGHRVLVIAGSGHTAILKDLLAIDSQRQAEEVSGYLTP